MLKKITLIILLTLSISAQDYEKVGLISKFGAAVGFTPVWTIPNASTMNNYLQAFGTEKINSSGFIGFGGSGYIYILVVKNLRVGGIGFGGTTTLSSANSSNRSAEYYSGMGGLTVEYTLPFTKDVAISVGGIIGGGSTSINLYQNNGSQKWDNIWNDFNSPSFNQRREIKNTFFTVSPTINIDYPINRFIAVRLGAGYTIPFSTSWESDNGNVVNNLPNDLSSNSFFIQTGVFIGFFAF
ncbi:MAG: hypothetical protein K8F60_00685 [Melioribacteraceae bacterium]|nr:hypothetical protein [Melioribacteraceae bacterium]